VGNRAHGERFMLLGPERVLYAGLLGIPTLRSLGAAAVYVAVAGSLEVEFPGGPIRRGRITVVPPYVPHDVRADERSIACVLLEPESVSPTSLQRLYTIGEDDPSSLRLAARIRDACAAGSRVWGSEFTDFEFDDLLFGARQQARELDPRISAVVAKFQVAPGRRLSGAACAQAANLSLSRFLHLFKSETGVSFKRFRAWKRARTILDHANRATNLTHLALEMGYPDLTHFSHSVRRIFGLQPSAIFAGSRRLRIVRGRAWPRPTTPGQVRKLTQTCLSN
jgi:AraC-like DNA-binding protein